MKRLLLIVSLFTIISVGCEDNEEEKLPYIDASVVWLGDKNPKDCSYYTAIDCDTYPGKIRLTDAYYVGVTKPEVPTSQYDGTDWVLPYKHQVSYVHYYKDDGYIKYNKIGYDTDRQVSTNDYLVSYTPK